MFRERNGLEKRLYNPPRVVFGNTVLDELKACAPRDEYPEWDYGNPNTNLDLRKSAHQTHPEGSVTLPRDNFS